MILSPSARRQAALLPVPTDDADIVFAGVVEPSADSAAAVATALVSAISAAVESAPDSANASASAAVSAQIAATETGADTAAGNAVTQTEATASIAADEATADTAGAAAAVLVSASASSVETGADVASGLAQLPATAQIAAVEAADSAQANARTPSATVINRLEKTVSISVTPPVPGTPGAPGTPGSPGQPYIPPHDYYEDVATVELSPVYATFLVPYDPNSGRPEHYETRVVGWEQTPRTERVLRHSPGQPYIPPTPPTPGAPPVPGSPPTINYDYHPGWNAGAISAGSAWGDAAYTFSVSPASSGVVTGLSRPESNIGESYAEIDYGLHFQLGVVRVMERGAAKTGFVAFTALDDFTVARNWHSIEYRKNGVTLYTSEAPSLDPVLRVDASLYYGGDGIDNASLDSANAASGSAEFPLWEAQGFSEDVGAIGTAAFMPWEAIGDAIIQATGTAEFLPWDAIGGQSAFGVGAAEFLPWEAAGSSGLMESTANTGTAEALPWQAFGLSSGQYGAVGGAEFLPWDAIGGQSAFGVGAAEFLPWEAAGGHLGADYVKEWSLRAVFPRFLLAEIDWLQGGIYAMRAEFPALAFDAREGMNLAAELPRLEARLEWLPGAAYQMKARLPRMEAEIGHVEEKVWAMRAVFPRLSALAASPAATAPAGMEAKLPALRARLEWLPGAAYALRAEFPRFSSQMAAQRQMDGALAATLPRLQASLAWEKLAAEAQTYAMNTETFAVTRYRNYPFTALGTVDGVPFGATASGVFMLQGASDAGAAIECTMLSGEGDFGDNRLKRVPIVHADIEGAAQINVACDGARSAYSFVRRSVLPLGLEGNRWAFGVKNVGGAAIVVRSIQPEIVPLKRRFKGRNQ